MKKHIKTIFLSIILGTGLFLFVSNFFIQPAAQKKAQQYASASVILSEEAKSNPMKFLALLSNAEIIVPGVLNNDDAEGLMRVRLKNNQAEFYTEKTKGTIMMPGILKTQKTVDGVDIFCDLVVNYGGPRSFHFIILFRLADNILTHTSSFSTGDQAEIIDIVSEVPDSNNYQVKALINQIGTSSEFTFSVKNHKIIE